MRCSLSQVIWAVLYLFYPGVDSVIIILPSQPKLEQAAMGDMIWIRILVVSHEQVILQ